MGKNFVVGDAVVGKIKKNQNRSGSIVEVIGAGHKCRIRVKWSDGTTTEETVRGIKKAWLRRISDAGGRTISIKMLKKVVLKSLQKYYHICNTTCNLFRNGESFAIFCDGKGLNPFLFTQTCWLPLVLLKLNNSY